MRFLKLSSGCLGTPERRLENRTMPVRRGRDLDLTNGTDPSAEGSLDYHFKIVTENLFYPSNYYTL